MRSPFNGKVTKVAIKNEASKKPAKKTTTTKTQPRTKVKAEKVMQQADVAAKKMKEMFGVVGHFQKNDTTSVVAEVSTYKESVRLDLREHLLTERYTGPTKHGINVEIENFMELYKLMTKVKEHLEKHGLLQE